MRRRRGDGSAAAAAVSRHRDAARLSRVLHVDSRFLVHICRPGPAGATATSAQGVGVRTPCCQLHRRRGFAHRDRQRRQNRCGANGLCNFATFLAATVLPRERGGCRSRVGRRRCLGPSWALRLMGFWKIPGAAALLIPRFPRLKEWAYAGATINYSSAVASHLIVEGELGPMIAPLALLGLTIASWALRPRHLDTPSFRLRTVVVRSWRRARLGVGVLQRSSK